MIGQVYQLQHVVYAQEMIEATFYAIVEVGWRPLAELLRQVSHLSIACDIVGAVSL